MIAADDLQLGKVVTILAWKNGDRSWVGKPMCVVSVTLPWIIVARIEDNDKPLRIDTRMVELVPAGPSLDAMRGGK